MAFMNLTGSIGTVYTAINTNITGSEFITLLACIILILMFFMAFRTPIEASVILVLPLILIIMAYTSNLYALGAVILMYIGVLVAKNYLIN